ncbi:CoA pyrophosphatase [Legionella sp. km772]|uniref:NUDIX hydrolase n=1 Tax=Legionella sp. km772 TaxID=2498111 RepID=UPI000F8EF74D|nr:CoA pyrophosphatase [Legionella sp. km772]RUR12808.1 CoA pyrophosphatase [Legionella sp. km772]
MDLNKIKKWTHAGVIVLHEHSTDCLILTKRSEHLRRHPGEVCFPGGVWEEGDENFYATALRELREELGIDSSRVSLIKELTREQTLLGSVIHPWLAAIDSIVPFHINDSEVASLISLPLAVVKNPKNYQEILVERSGFKFKSWQFIGHSEFIWGATARIMRQLIDW